MLIKIYLHLYLLMVKYIWVNFMTFEKNKTKHFLISVFIFLVGMLNVSISGVFGGYYCSAAAIIVVLATIYAYELFDKKINIKENMVELSLIGAITLLNILFFLVNDVFDINVYIKNSFNFWSVLVIISQLISIGSLVYVAAMFVINATKGKIEIVEENEKVNTSIKNEDTTKNTTEEDSEEKTNETKIEIKALEEKNEDEKDTPFMEEEK